MITIVNYFTNIIISLLGELNGNFDGAIEITAFNLHGKSNSNEFIDG